MSSDNFFFTHHNRVFQGFHSDADDVGGYCYFITQNHHPVYVGRDEQDAEWWAMAQQSEYGYYGTLEEVMGEDEVHVAPVDSDMVYDGHWSEWEDDDWSEDGTTEESDNGTVRL